LSHHLQLSIWCPSILHHCSRTPRITHIWVLTGLVWFVVLSSQLTKLVLKVIWLLEGQIQPYLVLSGLIWSYLTLSGLIWPDLALSGLIWNYPALSGLILSFCCICLQLLLNALLSSLFLIYFIPSCCCNLSFLSLCQHSSLCLILYFLIFFSLLLLLCFFSFSSLFFMSFYLAWIHVDLIQFCFWSSLDPFSFSEFLSSLNSFSINHILFIKTRQWLNDEGYFMENYDPLLLIKIFLTSQYKCVFILTWVKK